MMRKDIIVLSTLLSLVTLGLFLWILTGSVLAKPQLVEIGGSLTEDTVWTAANSPYVITDVVTIEAGVTLTVEAGVTVMFEVGAGQSMIVEGHLEVAGTAVSPVLITSIGDLPTNRWIGINVTSGSANFAHTALRYAETPLFIYGSAGGDVYLENSTLEENTVHPIVAGTDALHRLKMNNVMFNNNTPNRVGIDRGGLSVQAFAGNVLLTSQPGLEGYEDWSVGSVSLLTVPSGMTLTLEAGAAFMSDSVIHVDGHLQANGTALNPVVIDDRPEGNATVNYLFVGEIGSASLTYTTIRDRQDVGLGIGGQSDKPIVLQNVVLDNVGNFPYFCC